MQVLAAEKKILVGITAGIAAYKSAFLVRLLKKNGADVKVVLTPHALDFVDPAYFINTFRTSCFIIN